MDERFWQLKESAKWSLDVDERRRAIAELASSYGREAIQAISEVRDVAAYDEIKSACIAAIKSAGRSHEPALKTRKHRAKIARKRLKNKKKRS